MVDSKTSVLWCLCGAGDSRWVAKLVCYSRNTFRIPNSGAHTLRSRCNVCKKWLMAGGGVRGWRAAWLVAGASWLHCCTARKALRCAGLEGGTGQGSWARGGRGTSGQDGLWR